MKSIHKNMNNQTPPKQTKVPLTQRRLKTKPALMLMGILLLGNVFWFMLWIWPSDLEETKAARKSPRRSMAMKLHVNNGLLKWKVVTVKKRYKV